MARHGFALVELIGCVRQLVPAFQELGWSVARNGRITAEEKRVHADLTHALDKQFCILFADACNRVSKVKLKAGSQVWIRGTALDLTEGIISKRMNGAETDQTLRV